MRKYIVIRVEDAEEEFPENVVVAGGKVYIPRTNMGRLRAGIHQLYSDLVVRGADMVTRTPMMTKQESDTIERVFETALARAKREARGE